MSAAKDVSASARPLAAGGRGQGHDVVAPSAATQEPQSLQASALLLAVDAIFPLPPTHHAGATAASKEKARAKALLNMASRAFLQVSSYVAEDPSCWVRHEYAGFDPSQDFCFAKDAKEVEKATVHNTWANVAQLGERNGLALASYSFQSIPIVAAVLQARPYKGK